MQGSRGVANDPLTAKAVALGPTFSWISHTWDHADLTNMSYADAFTEFSLNDQAIRGLGLTPYATANLVTPGITGLDNAERDAGRLRRGHPLPGERHVDRRAGQPVAERRASGTRSCRGSSRSRAIPTDLDYDVSLPAEWVAAYNGRENTNRHLRADHRQGEPRAGRLPAAAANNDPWMFHQANTRDFGGGHSLLGDLLGATIDRYLAGATFPIVSPTMDELARPGDRSDAARRLRRVRDDSARAISDGPGRERRARPGHRAVHAERGGLRRPEDRVPRSPAGGSTTLSLADCNPGRTHRNGRRRRTGAAARRRGRRHWAPAAHGAARHDRQRGHDRRRGAGGTRAPPARAGTGGRGRNRRRGQQRRRRHHRRRGHGGNGGATGGAGTTGDAGTTGGAGTGGRRHDRRRRHRGNGGTSATGNGGGRRRDRGRRRERKRRRGRERRRRHDWKRGRERERKGRHDRRRGHDRRRAARRAAAARPARPSTAD